MTDQEIIKALRCSATVHTKKPDCTGCPCHVVEEVPEEFRRELGGIPSWWDSCDVDKMALAAAKRLEELTGGTGK